MNFVDKNLGIKRVPGIGIRVSRVVAEDAKPHFSTAASMGRQRIMALVAVLRTHNVANLRDWRAGRNKIQVESASKSAGILKPKVYL
jgi:hypothetical protein